MSPELTPRAQRDIEDSFDNQREAFRLLELIYAEWSSDPMSVQCFDLRIVEAIREATRLTLENAAKVAERHVPSSHGAAGEASMRRNGQDIAVAIRALVEI